MSWPTATDYLSAVQHPARRYSRPELKRGQIALDVRGKPIVRSGKWVDIFELRGAGGQERWAIGCFTHEPRGLARRFELINEHLRAHPVPALAHTEYIEQGMSIRGRWYPITRSLWIDGLPLNEYVREYLDHPDELRLLATMWLSLAEELRQAGVAHCNLACDTVLVSPQKGGSLALRLVDYDAIFVPALVNEPPAAMGHGDFQHPQRSWQGVYCSSADRFSQLVVLTALYALAAEGRALWDRYDNGHNLLFRHSDFQEPATSSLLRGLWQSESSKVRQLTGHLILACHAPATGTPPLEVVAECLRGGSSRSALSAQQNEQVSKILDLSPGGRGFELEIDDGPGPAATAGDDFKLEVDDDPIAVVYEAVRPGPPPLPVAAPPPLPAAARQHPLTQTYEFEAWLPEQVAVVKLQGFVRDIGGEVVQCIPGFVRVQLFDEQDLAVPRGPGFLAWLGLVEQAAQGPRVLAVMELHLIHKPTPTRKLIGITMRLAPGTAEVVSLPRWKGYCDRIFCELRGYMIGFFS